MHFNVIKSKCLYCQWLIGFSALYEISNTQMVTKWNTRFNYTYTSYDTIGRKMCVKECDRSPSCLSVNFHKEQLKCELVSLSSDANPEFSVADTGFEHIVINKTSVTPPINTLQVLTAVLGRCNEVLYRCVLGKSGESLCTQTGERSTFDNIAKNKTIQSSSVWDDDLYRYDPQHLIDGVRSAQTPYCAATKEESQPWFAVDLKNVYQIDHVHVYTGWNKGEPCNAYQVRVGKSGTWNEMTSCGEGSQAQDETIVCKDCLLGRYVQLQLISNDSSCHIVTCEVEVIGSLI